MIFYFSGKHQLVLGEVTIYQANSNNNIVSFGMFEKIKIHKKLKENELFYCEENRTIVVKDDPLKNKELLMQIISLAKNNNIDRISIVYGYNDLENFKNLLNYLYNVESDIVIRLILNLEIIKKYTLENKEIVKTYISNNYHDSRIQYSIGLSIDELRNAKISTSKELSNLVKEKEIILEKSFSDKLFEIIDNKNLNDVDVYKRANVDKRLFSKIRSNKDFRPSRSTALSLCIALRLDLEETESLLKTAGMSLSNSDLSDVIIKAFISNGLFNIDEINLCLLERNLKPLTYY